MDAFIKLRDTLVNIHLTSEIDVVTSTQLTVMGTFDSCCNLHIISAPRKCVYCIKKVHEAYSEVQCKHCRTYVCRDCQGVSLRSDGVFVCKTCQSCHSYLQRIDNYGGLIMLHQHQFRRLCQTKIPPLHAAVQQASYSYTKIVETVLDD